MVEMPEAIGGKAAGLEGSDKPAAGGGEECLVGENMVVCVGCGGAKVSFGLPVRPGKARGPTARLEYGGDWFLMGEGWLWLEDFEWDDRGRCLSKELRNGFGGGYTREDRDLSPMCPGRLFGGVPGTGHCVPL